MSNVTLSAPLITEADKLRPLGKVDLSKAVSQQMLLEVGFGMEEQKRAKEAFRAVCLPGSTMTVEQFEKIFEPLCSPPLKPKDYFRVFNRSGEANLIFEDFLLGCILMDPQTRHGGAWGFERLRYIFRLYHGNNLCELDTLALDEVLLMIYHIIKLSEPDALPKRLEEFTSLVCPPNVPMRFGITEAEFVEAIRLEKLRGTSKLLRFPLGFTARSILLDKALKMETTKSSDPQLSRSTELPGSPAVKKVRLVQELVSWNGMEGSGVKTEAIHPESPALKARNVTIAKSLRSSFTGTLSFPQSTKEINTDIAKRVIETVLLDNYSVPDTNSTFNLLSNSQEVFLLCDAAYHRLTQDSILVRVNAPCRVFGDIHGQLAELLSFFKRYGSPNNYTGDVLTMNYIFNGDFVDRGPNSLETITLLVALKVMYPTRVFLVRGNHEDRIVNINYGFREECIRRCGPQSGEEVWLLFNAVFDWIPLCALIEEKIIVMHGGIGNKFERTQQLEEVQRPLTKPQESVLARDILWSDPTESDHVLGVHANPRGEQIYRFGPDRVTEFCVKNNIELVIRSHECVDTGFQYFASGHLVTVFSATDYCKKHKNSGAILEIFVDGSAIRVLPKVIKPCAENNDPGFILESDMIV